MGLRKYLAGKILRNDEEKAEQKEAAKNFTEKDKLALRAELADLGRCRDGLCDCRKET